MNYRQIAIAAALLFLFAVIGVGLVAYTYDHTAERIADNERIALLRSINELLPADQYDNDIFHDTMIVPGNDLLGTDEPVTIYRARKQGWPVAAVLTVIAPDGYNGNIKLLVAIKLDGTLAGVRVVSHKETPGLGDAIEIERSNWILGFNNRSLNNPPSQKWKVRRDGGEFDQFTGATITPRAVVKAVHKALLYFQTRHQRLFAQEAEKSEAAQ